mgnify:CR=1 FL=1
MYFKINTKVREAVFYEYPDIDKLFSLNMEHFHLSDVAFGSIVNLPGFPAGVIMPLSGSGHLRGEISFPLVMVLTVAAGLTGSWRCIGWEEQAEIRCWLLLQEISETKGSSGE